LFPKTAEAFTPAARIPRQFSGTEQLRGNLKVCLPYKHLFDRMFLLLHKLFWDARRYAVSEVLFIIPTRSLNRNLNQFELSFIARGILIISVVCQILST